jgi:hypothetical protein
MRLRIVRIVLVSVPLVVAVAGACATTTTDDTSSTTTIGAPEDFVAQAPDFVALTDMTPIRGFFIDNRLGHLDEAVAVANDPNGGVYPVGTIIQLVPQEAMVKRAPGFDATSNDWEFFALDVSPSGTAIVTRGGAEVINRFGGTSCSECHRKARPQFDFVCEQTNGCDPLPISNEVIAAVQRADPRPAAATAAS